MQQPPIEPRPAAEARPIDADLGDVMTTSGGPLHPRWALLASLACIVLVAVAGVLWNVLPCFDVLGRGRLCQASSWPGPVQVALLGLAFVLAWLLIYAFGHRLQEPRLRHGDRAPVLRTLSEPRTLGPLVAVFGLVGALLAALALQRGRGQPLPTAIALLPGLVAIWTFLYRPPGRPVPQTAEERVVEAQARRASPLFRLRSLPFLRRLWPARPPAAPEAAQAAQAAQAPQAPADQEEQA